MAYEQLRMSRSLSLLELALSVLLLCIFASLFLQRVLVMTVAAEDRYLELAINQIRAELMIWSADKLIAQRYEEIASLTHENPVGIAFQAPANYAGAAPKVDAASMAPGSWLFETDTGRLIYRVSNTDYFHNESGTPPLVRLDFELSYEDRDHNGHFDQGVDVPRQVLVKVLDRYTWKY
jgi:hypothetical protein